MRIALDARSIYRPNRRGTGKNLVDLYRHLAAACPHWQVMAFCRQGGPLEAILPEQVEPASKGKEHRLVDSDGNVYAYRVNEPVAGGIAVVAGFIAAFFGIGGGPINVPVMMLALRMPSQIAVATSQLGLMVASAAAVAVHLALSSSETDQWIRALILGGGTLVGAQIGIRLLAGRIGAKTVLLAISASLLIAGARQVATGLA